MFQLFTRCFYTYSKKFYDQPSSFWNSYYVDLLTLSYGFVRFLYIIYRLKWDTQNTESLQTTDPGLFILSRLDFLIVMILLIFFIFYFFTETLLMTVNVNLKMWRFWRQVVIELQDNYFQSVLSKEKNFKMQEKKVKKLKQKYLIFNSFLMSKWTQKKIAYFFVWINFENINQRWFDSQNKRQKQINGQPIISASIKRETVLAMLVFDKIAFGVQIITGITLVKFLIF